MPNSLFPAAVKIEYDSPYAPHTMILPIAEPNTAVPPALATTTVDTWAGGTIALGTMVTALVDVLKAFYTAGTVFRIASLLKINLPPADQTPIPLFSWGLNIPGTSVSTTWNKATQQTLTFRTAEGGQSKIVMLDHVSFNDFNKIIDLTGQAALQAIVDQWTADTNGWAGRDTSRPLNFLQAAKTLNEALRKSYRMN